jgi:hypothetical protein
LIVGLGRRSSLFGKTFDRSSIKKMKALLVNLRKNKGTHLPVTAMPTMICLYGVYIIVSAFVEGNKEPE